VVQRHDQIILPYGDAKASFLSHEVHRFYPIAKKKKKKASFLAYCATHAIVTSPVITSPITSARASHLVVM
jgi:hypothetical protein